MECYAECIEHQKSKLKRPCRCGGHHFVEPEMKRVNCFPKCCRRCTPCCRCCHRGGCGCQKEQ